MNLYEIDSAIEALIDGGLVVDEETGEVLFEPADIEQLDMELDRKLEGIGCWLKNLRASAKSMRDEEAALKKRREAVERRAESVERYVKGFIMDRCGGRFEGAKCAMGIRRSRSVAIDNERIIPREYMRTKTTEEPIKAKIMTAIKAGRDVPGAHIEEGVRLQLK